MPFITIAALIVGTMIAITVTKAVINRVKRNRAHNAACANRGKENILNWIRQARNSYEIKECRRHFITWQCDWEDTFERGLFLKMRDELNRAFEDKKTLRRTG